MTGDQIESLALAIAAHLKRFNRCFKRRESREHFRDFVTGLTMPLRRKNVEAIALARDKPVRTMQEFLAFFAWDHERAEQILQMTVAEEHGCDGAIGVIDASSHAKSGSRTPGVNRQWCGERGKIENCVVGQHLLYVDDNKQNPFTCVVASDLFLPESWSEDRERCENACIPDDIVHRPKWKIAIEQIERSIANGIQFKWITFDEDYGQIPPFWFELDKLNLLAIGEVRTNFRCWTRLPHWKSLNRAHASKRVDNVCRYSPVFTKQEWQRVRIKGVTRGEVVWDIKRTRVHLVDASSPSNCVSHPTERKYWLMIARNPETEEIKYFVSNAPARTTPIQMLRVAFSRWHVEKWFERAKQETGFGDFEIRTYTSLIRHWLCSRIAMYILTCETTRLRGEKSADHIRAGIESGPDSCGGSVVLPRRGATSADLRVRVPSAP